MISNEVDDEQNPSGETDSCCWLLVLVGEFIAAVVDSVVRDVLRRRRRRVVDHTDQCDAQVDSQTVDVEEAEERQQRQDKSARRELYSDTPNRA